VLTHFDWPLHLKQSTHITNEQTNEQKSNIAALFVCCLFAKFGGAAHSFCALPGGTPTPKIHRRCRRVSALQILWGISSSPECTANDIGRTQFVGNVDSTGRNVSSRRAFCAVIVGSSSPLEWRCSANGSSLATSTRALNFRLAFCGLKFDVAVAAGENSYENFCLFAANVYWYGAGTILVCERCAGGDGKRLRRTRWLLRKSHSQWRASKLLSNDSGSSPIAIWHARSRLSQWMRHSSH
jgi:hypothetical protein